MRLTLPAGGPRRFLRYPLLVPDQPHLAERLALRLQRFGPISCTVCGQLSSATRFGTSPLDFRDAAYCPSSAAGGHTASEIWAVSWENGGRALVRRVPTPQRPG